MSGIDDDFNDRDRAERHYIESLPVCSECGYPIQDDYMYDINGSLICEKCLNSIYRKENNC